MKTGTLCVFRMKDDIRREKQRLGNKQLVCREFMNLGVEAGALERDRRVTPISEDPSLLRTQVHRLDWREMIKSANGSWDSSPYQPTARRHNRTVEGHEDVESRNQEYGYICFPK